MIHKDRLQKLQAEVKACALDAYIVEDGTNLFYLTGIEMSAGTLLVTDERAALFVDGRYFEMCRSLRHVTVVPIDEWALTGFPVVGFDKTTTSYDRYVRLKEMAETLQPVDDLTAVLRTIKDDSERALLREAGKLGSAGFDYVRSILQEGITEREVASRLDIFWKQAGATGVAFTPIIAFGKSGSKPHYHPADVSLQRGDAVLVDIGVTLDHYHSDMTRVVFFGDVPEKVRHIFAVVKEAQEASLALCRPGTTIHDLDRAARFVIEEAGFGEAFTHSLGHGIGLEVHERPFLRTKNGSGDSELREGMAITIEPGIYLPDVGGVRIEDTVIITADGHENLTNRPKDGLL